MGRYRTMTAQTLLLLLAATTASRAATSPWSGTWTLDRARSSFTSETLRIGRVATGYHFDFGAVQFDIGDDGRFYPTVSGRTTSLRPVGPLEWVRVHRAKGRDFEHSTLRITPDQQTLTIDSETVEPGGGVHRSQDVEHRVGSGQDLAGTWRATTPGINVPTTIVLQRLADGRMRIDDPQDGNYFVAIPGGPPAVNQGPRAVSAARLVLRSLSPTEMRWTVELQGRPYQHAIDTLSAGGDLIETSWSEMSPGERQRAVYRRTA